MRRLGLLALLVWALLLPAAAPGAGVNVFVGSPTIPSVGGATVLAPPIDATGDVVAPGASGSGAALTANLWVVASGGSCSARQSSATTLAGAATSAKCTSWPAAYQLATNGDTVGVTGGVSYGTQNFTSCNATLTGSDHVVRDGSEVTFQPDAGTVPVSLQGFTNCRYNVTFKNVADCPDTGVSSAHDIHFVGVDCVGGEMFMGSGGHHISIEGSDFGPYAIACGGAAKLMALWGVNNVLIQGNTFHDMSATEGCGTHPDAIEACGTPCGSNPAVHHVTIRANRFWSNACDSGRFQDGTDHDFLIENNMYGAAVTFESGCGQSLAAANPATVVRYNTFNAPVDMTNKGTGYADNAWYGNLFLGTYNCTSGVGTIAYNVGPTGSPTTCGTGQPNTVASSMSGWFTDAATGDLHLTSCSTTANNAGDAANFPTTDFDGGTRSNPPDAGADECGAP